MRQIHIRKNPATGGWYCEEDSRAMQGLENFANTADARATLIESLRNAGVDLDTVQTETHVKDDDWV